METTRHTNTASSTNRLTVPFYAPPPNIKKTSAEIISEARASIIHENEGIRIESTRMAASIRPLNTKRPFTPRERQRTLFGAAHNSKCRPPSSFSLGYLQLQDADLGSSLGTPTSNIRRLNPIPATLSSASLSTGSSLIDVRDWKTLLSSRDSEGSAGVLGNRSRTLSPQPFGTFLTPDQISCVANKFRLPSIEGVGKPLLSHSHRFRATASLDNLPEELEIDESESQESGVSSSSAKDAALARKAYSSPVQRTRSVDTELCRLPSAVEGKALETQPSHHTDTDSGINKGGAKSVNLRLSKMNEETAKNGLNTAKVAGNNPYGRNIVNLGFLEDEKNRQIIHERVQKYPSYTIIGKEENLLDSIQRNSSALEAPLQQGPDFVAHREDSTLGCIQMSRPKSKNSFSSNESESNKNVAQKEYSSQEPQLDGSARGPASKNNENSWNKFASNSQIQEEKDINLNMMGTFTSSSAKKDSKQISKHDPYVNRSSLVVNPVVKDNRVSVSESELGVEHISDPKLQNLPVTQQPPSNDVVLSVTSATEMWTKNTQAEKCVSARKKSKSEYKDVLPGAEDKWSYIQSILSMLNSLAGKADECTEEIVLCMSKLYSALECVGGTGKNIQNLKLRTQVLKTVYKFVESSNDILLLQIARIILVFQVSGKNLLAVCKLVFKVSRCDKNDKLFLEDNILELFVEVLGLASPLEDAESCVYGYGALKFLTMNNVLLAKVLKLGILELMVLHMKMVNAVRVEGSRIPEQTSHALFQLTGALRNVAGEEEIFPQFVSTGAVNELCRAVELFASDLDVISNISRTLSIISTHNDCCTSIVDYENSFKIFVRLFQKYPGRQDIVVRLGYALGNLMANSDTARTKFFNEDGAVASMLHLLTIYLEKDLQMLEDAESYSKLNSDAGSNGSVEDVIVKIIRIIANMSINPVVGSSLTCSSAVFCCNNVQEIETEPSDGTTTEDNKDGGQFLDILLTILRRKSVVDSEELVHSVLSTLNNLSYYPTSNDGAFGERQLEIAQALCSLLHTSNKDCLVEATRVYGNLTRSKDTRDFLVESGAWNQLLKFLDWDDQELLCTTVGILVNMMADWDKRVALKEGHGIERLTKVLNKFGEGNWHLATLVCQALWNYCTESTNLHAALGIDQTNHLLAILVDLLDEERLFGVAEGAEVNEELATSEHYQLWEEFAGVATNLLEKMESFLDASELLIGDNEDAIQLTPFT